VTFLSHENATVVNATRKCFVRDFSLIDSCDYVGNNEKKRRKKNILSWKFLFYPFRHHCASRRYPLHFTRDLYRDNLTALSSPRCEGERLAGREDGEESIL